MPCIGTLILVVLATWISPLTSWRLVPAVPCRSPDQNHAISTPDTTHPITRSPVSLSQGIKWPLVLMSNLNLRRINNSSALFVFLIPTCTSYLSHFSSMLMTITLNDSHLKWFEACFWKPTSKGLPSSSTELMH